MLLAGLEEPDPEVQRAATRAILQQGHRAGIAALIGSFHTLAPEVADELFRHPDDFFISFHLRETLSAEDPQARRNAVDLIRRANRMKLAYLLVQALSDAEEDIRAKALDGLKKLAESYHEMAERVRSGEVQLSRIELETRKFALLDPVMGLLGNLSLSQPDELLLLAMGLDARANDMLFAMLVSNQDPRAETLDRFLWNSATPQVISFLLDCLRDVRVANRALTVIQERRDLPFVKALLSNHRFFSDYRVRERLEQVQSIDPLKATGETEGPGVAAGPRKDIFANALLALRGIHFALLSGVPVDQKEAFLREVAAAELPMFVTGIAESLLKAMNEGRGVGQISLALVYLERQMGLPAGSTAKGAPVKKGAPLEVPELELPWAHPQTESIPGDAFTQFFNTFDRLDDATKLLAIQTLKRLDPGHLEHIQRELSSLEPGRRLKAVRIVVMFHREQEVEQTLLRLASDRDRHVRATVVKTLGILEDEAAIRALLEAVTDVDRRVVANSVEAIETVGREELLGLVNIFAGHPNNRIRANAIKALWTMGDGSATKRLEEMLQNDDEMMRLSATWLLGEIDHTGRIDMLMKLAKTDPSELVRAKARSILGEGD